MIKSNLILYIQCKTSMDPTNSCSLMH